MFAQAEFSAPSVKKRSIFWSVDVFFFLGCVRRVEYISLLFSGCLNSLRWFENPCPFISKVTDRAGIGLIRWGVWFILGLCLFACAVLLCQYCDFCYVGRVDASSNCFVECIGVVSGYSDEIRGCLVSCRWPGGVTFSNRPVPPCSLLSKAAIVVISPRSNACKLYPSWCGHLFQSQFLCW